MAISSRNTLLAALAFIAFQAQAVKRHRGVSNLSRTGESGSGRQHLC